MPNEGATTALSQRAHTPAIPDDQHEDTGRIEELIAALDALAEPRAAEVARALVEAVLVMHAHALKRLVDHLAATKEGRAVLEALAAEPAVSNVMLLHGVHPHDVATRIDRALGDLRAWLGPHKIAVHMVSAQRGRVCVRLEARGSGRKPKGTELRDRIETIVFEHAPEVEAVEIEGLPLAEIQAIRFMRRQAVSPKSSASVEGE